MLSTQDVVKSVSELRELPDGSVVRIDNVAGDNKFDVAIRKETDGVNEDEDWTSVNGQRLRSDTIIKDFPDAVVTVLFVSDGSAPDKLTS